jgi:hypothetical protein
VGYPPRLLGSDACLLGQLELRCNIRQVHRRYTAGGSDIDATAVPVPCVAVNTAAWRHRSGCGLMPGVLKRD